MHKSISLMLLKPVCCFLLPILFFPLKWFQLINVTKLTYFKSGLLPSPHSISSILSKEIQIL